MSLALWLLSPEALVTGVGLVGILAVLLIAWALVHREPYEYQAMDRAYWASQRTRATRRARDQRSSSRRRSPGR